MYPLLLSAPLKDYLWGGNRLKTDFGFESEMEKVAEAWVLSCHKDGESLVKNGKYAGLTLSKAIEKFGDDSLGEKGKEFSYFPILIKLIDAKDRLSLQVHPDDEYALANEGEYGKTEMWYIVDCEEDAKLIYGVKKTLSKEELEAKIQNDTVTDICNFVSVHKGDVFFIPAGTLHAIGKGIVIAEIQQNSNTTYRVSDYGRLGADGKPRQLHKKQAVEVINRQPSELSANSGEEITIYPFGIVKNLASCEKFTADHLSLNGKAGLCEEKSFLSVLILEGECVLSYADGNMRLVKGNSVFVPAKMRIELMGEAEIILSHV